MVVIRLARRGAKKKPFYHITAADKRSPRDGRYIERLGYYNPIASGQAIRLNVDLDRVDYWLSVGAQTSDKVSRLLREARNAPPEVNVIDEDTSSDASAESEQQAAVEAEVDSTVQEETAAEESSGETHDENATTDDVEVDVEQADEPQETSNVDSSEDGTKPAKDEAS